MEENKLKDLTGLRVRRTTGTATYICKGNVFKKSHHSDNLYVNLTRVDSNKASSYAANIKDFVVLSQPIDVVKKGEHIVCIKHCFKHIDYAQEFEVIDIQRGGFVVDTRTGLHSYEKHNFMPKDKPEPEVTPNIQVIVLQLPTPKRFKCHWHKANGQHKLSIVETQGDKKIVTTVGLRAGDKHDPLYAFLTCYVYHKMLKDFKNKKELKTHIDAIVDAMGQTTPTRRYQRYLGVMYARYIELFEDTAAAIAFMQLSLQGAK